MCAFTGGTIASIELHDNEGGATWYSGGDPRWILPFGYIGSSLIGGLLVFSGFNRTAVKCSALLLEIALLVLVWYGNWYARLIIGLFLLAIPGMWYLDDKKDVFYLTYFILFMGYVSVNVHCAGGSFGRNSRSLITGSKLISQYPRDCKAPCRRCTVCLTS